MIRILVEGRGELPTLFFRRMLPHQATWLAGLDVETDRTVSLAVQRVRSSLL
jgi:hypothetical protein